MLVCIQFPLADFRRFLNNPTNLLSRPGWPTPEPEYEFVRSFGGIQTRKRGGLLGWVGENEICEANKALRFNQIPTHVDSKLRVPLRCAFRRLFLDGLAVGKFETGISTVRHRSSVLNFPSPSITQEFINHVLDIPVSVRNRITGVKTTALSKAGKPLAQAYAAASTALPQSTPNTWEEWWVMAGPPLLFLELTDEEYVELPSPAKTVVSKEDGHGFELRYCLMPYAGKHVRTWVLQLDSLALLNAAHRQAVRSLRLYLLRLNAEHECLRLVLRHLESKKISVSRGTIASEKLQRYLNDATMKINRWESKSEQLINTEIVRIARLSEDSTSPGRRDALLQRLYQLDIRPNLARKVEEYTARWQDVPSGRVIFNYFDGGVQQVGDNYEISGSSNQIGAVGPDAHVHDINFSQRWNEVGDGIDLPQLAQELSLLRAKLRSEAVEPDHDEVVAEVGRAENAARADKGPQALEHLAKAGNWALNAATAIGTMVAAAAIRMSLGLP